MAGFKGQLTQQQMEKARACKSTDELVGLAKSEGIELSDEQLDSIAGGDSWVDYFCDSYCWNRTW